MYRLMPLLILAGILACSLPAFADGESVHVEMINASGRDLTVQFYVNAFPSLRQLPERTLKNGEKTTYTKAQTVHEKAGEEAQFLGWIVKFDKGCPTYIQHKAGQCTNTGSSCDKARIELLAPCAYRLTIEK
ncbi:hypothetical protein GM415_10155 [Pseudodesulfovibrio cashew]|uniref:Uncharacterized protein n=1 Tax=Pseudodesulfovibrio cashew TaxID=2678688 RepID=A0A6I6JEA9_9BACT|nr:hypothetical protein [Pseudodesulfovibrio cashew]QGY40471.1 hypothetical protein GM415_10155 [Pseudodesulfovibrio cashew]